MTRFDGKVLFCTGGGSGIGAEVSRRFSREGGRVAVVDINGETAEAVAGELDAAISIATDISDEASVVASVQRAVDELGPITSVYNGAGNLSTGTIDEVTVEQYRSMINVHMIGTMVVCREALKSMRTIEGGSIVNTASVVALIARHTLAPYGAVKGGVLAFSRQLALEVAPKIRVNSVSPGRTVTGMTRPLYTELGGGDLQKGMLEAGKEVMLGRVADPSELAAAICFLLSDDASYISGTDLVVDAGMTAV
jgi:NAD(P)-dependent dehydrogenase (short-subunit alcohol dehydrogenase family)